MKQRHRKGDIKIIWEEEAEKIEGQEGKMGQSCVNKVVFWSRATNHRAHMSVVPASAVTV